MKTAAIVTGVAALVNGVVGHATFQQLWVNGVDQVCALSIPLFYPLTVPPRRAHVHDFPKATALSPMSQAPKFNVMPTKVQQLRNAASPREIP